jgi:acyl carrier protein
MKEKFLDLIKETLEIEGRELAMEDKFKEYAEWDSLGLLSVIAAIDEEYGVVVEGNKFKDMNTLEELFAEIEKSKA